MEYIIYNIIDLYLQYSYHYVGIYTKFPSESFYLEKNLSLLSSSNNFNAFT